MEEGIACPAIVATPTTIASNANVKEGTDKGKNR